MSEVKDPRGIFDHIESVTTRKNPSYFESLSEEEKKTYNPFLINRMIGADLSFIPMCFLVTISRRPKGDPSFERKLLQHAYPKKRPDLKSKV